MIVGGEVLTIEVLSVTLRSTYSVEVEALLVS
jgi:hypothetical protein